MKRPHLRIASVLTGMIAGLMIGLLPSAHAAESRDLGRNLAATCASCHNTNGKAIGDSISLAGLPAERIVQLMTQFREGKRAATIMEQLAKGYTPEQVQLIADYFAAQK